MRYLPPLIIGFLALGGCSEPEKPSLNCTVQHLGPRTSPAVAAKQVERRIEATLSEPANNLWKFSGTITSAMNDEEVTPISGHYYRYPNGNFDLVASTDAERITVMPSNALLRSHELQGVVMRGGETVSTGLPITASCQVSIPEGD
ncbi:hypothetical protein [Altererythrobacter litoralis]|uniref:Lipoprotein n=1 Tax=Altererythrobacter litoralis TaxID=3113904 RepID=A0ABU7GFQ9_9SPHN|nr:hypothetical protein [Erythrobacteraceae bacterium 1XM1-14]